MPERVRFHYATKGKPLPAERHRLTRPLLAEIVKLLKKGLPREHAAAYVGCEYSRFLEWTKLGEAYLIANEPREHAIFGEFVLETRKATSAYVLAHVEQLSTAYEWRRHLAILERRDRANFSRVEVPGGSLDSIDPDERYY